MTAITKARFMDGLVLWLPMAEGAGTRVNDLSKYGNNGAITDATWVAGRDGLPGLSFDGAGDVVIVPHSTSISPVEITVSAWVYLRTGYGETYPRILTKREGTGGYDWYLDAGTGALSFYWIAADTTWDAISFQVMTENVYTHVAVTYDYPQAFAYINGRLIRSETTTKQLAASTIDLRLGNIAGLDRTLDGILGDVLIYNRALDPYEIRSLSEMVRKI